LKHLDLDNVSPRLLKCHDLELAVPGTYRAGREVIRINSIEGHIGVIASKQRPRKLVMNGSDGKGHLFLLKGHEDLRQDERVMQLFGLVNALLQNDPETHKRHLAIERFSVIPLSQNTGLIGWLPHCDTMHTVIKKYREARGIPLSLEHRAMLQFAPDYDHLTKLQKMEVFSGAVRSTDGNDLARAFWLNSGNAESWLERRTNYSRSLAVMSMTGYVLGLGDRHPSNLMFDQRSGNIVHIDFGDCFEVAMQRDRFPERVPFRLTRMLVEAMEASGIEGTFRIVCEETLRVLRSNKDSVMAVLEAFVYDPLINWRLLAKTTAVLGNPATSNPQCSPTQDQLRSFTLREATSWARFPDDFSNSRKIRRGSEITQLGT
jgi:serine/threonine-protein kinase mTOR